MAISVQSTSSAVFTTTPLVITKPTGLAIGDLMVTCIGFDYDFFNISFTPPTGWLFVPSSSMSFPTIMIWKIADATDTAASNFSFPFTFSAPATRAKAAGIIFRITGTSISPSMVSSTDDGSELAANPVVFSNTITPPSSDCLLIFCASTRATSTATSSLAITTSNPTWTLAYEVINADGSFTSSYAIRTAATATGNSSFDVVSPGFPITWFATIAAISPLLGPINMYTWNGVTKSTISTMNGTALSAIDKWNDVT